MSAILRNWSGVIEALSLFGDRFQHRAAEGVLGHFAVARKAGVLDEPNENQAAVLFDVADIRESTKVLLERDYELGVHGIDSWHSSAKGKEERSRVSEAAATSAVSASASA